MIFEKIPVTVLTAIAFLIASCSQQKRAITSSKSTTISHQEKKTDSLAGSALLDRNYRYLDKDFKIHIDSKTFDSISANYRTAKTYKDSLMYIVADEFKDDAMTRKAFHQIAYSWKRVGAYIIEDTENAEKFGTLFGFKHPYRFLLYLRNDSITDTKRTEFLQQIKDKLERATGKKVMTENAKEILDQAFDINPERVHLKKQRRP